MSFRPCTGARHQPTGSNIVELEHSSVHRGGAWDQREEGTTDREETEVYGWVCDGAIPFLDPTGFNHLMFRFDIPSTGGGRTDLILSIGRSDVVRLLEEVAATPDGIKLLSDAISVRAAADSVRAAAEYERRVAASLRPTEGAIFLKPDFNNRTCKGFYAGKQFLYAKDTPPRCDLFHDHFRDDFA